MNVCITAPAAPQNLIIDHLSDLQSIDVSFDYPESAEIKGFQIQVYELDDEGEPNDSTENILEDSSISLPILLNADVQTYRMKLAKLASVYKVIVRSESTNGQISIRFASQNIITGWLFQSSFFLKSPSPRKNLKSAPDFNVICSYCFSNCNLTP